MRITHTASMFSQFLSSLLFTGGGGGAFSRHICTMWLMSQGMSTFWLMSQGLSTFWLWTHPQGMSTFWFTSVRYAIDIRIAALSNFRLSHLQIFPYRLLNLGRILLTIIFETRNRTFKNYRFRVYNFCHCCAHYSQMFSSQPQLYHQKSLIWLNQMDVYKRTPLQTNLYVFWRLLKHEGCTISSPHSSELVGGKFGCSRGKS